MKALIIVATVAAMTSSAAIANKGKGNAYGHSAKVCVVQDNGDDTVTASWMPEALAVAKGLDGFIDLLVTTEADCEALNA